MTFLRRWATVITAIFLLTGVAMVSAGVVDLSPGLLAQVKAKWGWSAVSRMHDWRETELKGQAVRAKGDLEAIGLINRFWNEMPFYSDARHWGVEDYWATPVEALASDGADCEDYSIAKFFSLKNIGLPNGRLRITYVRAQKRDEAHMVLAYYPTPQAEPYILDNLNGKVLPASERADLEPVYSFNDEDMWVAGATGFKGTSSQIRLWVELLEKMEIERRL